MFPWFDLLLVGIVFWGGLAGFLIGSRRALLRLVLLVVLSFLAIAGVKPCALYLGPSLQPLAVSGYNHLALPATAVPHSAGPWRALLAAQTATGTAYTLLSLTVNVATMSVLLGAMLVVTRLFEKPSANTFSTGGLVIGTATGIIGAILFSTVAPVLVLGRCGAALALGAGESQLAVWLNPAAQLLVRLIAPFIL